MGMKRKVHIFIEFVIYINSILIFCTIYMHDNFFVVVHLWWNAQIYKIYKYTNDDKSLYNTQKLLYSHEREMIHKTMI